MSLVSLSGFAGSGKTTFAEELVRVAGFTRLSFAGTLKLEVEQFLQKHGTEYEERHLYGNGKDKEEILNLRLDWTQPWSFEEMWFWTWFKVDCVHITPRLLMQLWGTEFRRTHFGENYWGDKLEPLITSAPDTNFVVDDTRFKNELDRMRRLGALLLWIDRYDSPAFDHASETDLVGVKGWHGVIENRGTLEEFTALAQMIARRM